MIRRSQSCTPRIRSFVCAFIFIFCVTLFSAHADDRETNDLVIHDAEALSSKDMGAMRAGFVDPSGYLVSFAVDVRTTIDGSLMFVRSLVLSQVNGQLQATSNAELIAGNIPAGATASLIDDGKGISVTDKNGNTTLLNQTARGTFANVILNQASNRTISQSMNIDIVLRNVQSVTSGAINGATEKLVGFSALAQTARAQASGFKF